MELFQNFIVFMIIIFCTWGTMQIAGYILVDMLAIPKPDVERRTLRVYRRVKKTTYYDVFMWFGAISLFTIIVAALFHFFTDYLEVTWTIGIS